MKKGGSHTRRVGEELRVHRAADAHGEATRPERGVEALRDGDQGERGGVRGDVQDQAESVGGRGEELASEENREMGWEQRGTGELCE